jgi:hypothetical protein
LGSTSNTPFGTGKELREKLRKVSQYPPWEWAYGSSKKLYSFHDLSVSPWSAVCDTATVHEHDTASLAFSDDRQARNIFVQLLDGCLKEQLRSWRIGYSKEDNCNYFLPDRTKIVREITYQSRSQRTSREVVKRYHYKSDRTRIAYYRHNGLSHRFLKFGDTWHLMIEPTYVFTLDGKSPDPYRQEHLAKIKSMEGDAAISGSIFMFADLLRDRATLFEDPYEFLGFGQIKSYESDVGIDDELWARMKSRHDELYLKVDQDNSSSFGKGLFDRR